MISTRLTSLIVLLAAVTCFALAIWTTVYEARLYLAYVGIMLLVCGVLIEITGLLFERDRREFRGQMPAPKDWPR